METQRKQKDFSNLKILMQITQNDIDCKAGNHVYGEIQGKTVKSNEWPEAYATFERVVRQFEIDNQRKQVPHPGFAFRYKFCMHCAKDLRLIDKKKSETPEKSNSN